jgi:hypothetical protein
MHGGWVVCGVKPNQYWNGGEVVMGNGRRPITHVEYQHLLWVCVVPDKRRRRRRRMRRRGRLVVEFKGR